MSATATKRRGRPRLAPYVPPLTPAQRWNEARQNLVYWQEKAALAERHDERVRAGALVLVWKAEVAARQVLVEARALRTLERSEA